MRRGTQGRTKAGRARQAARILGVGLVLATGGSPGLTQSAEGRPREVYYSGFEEDEGYTSAEAEEWLWGQQGWTGYGSGGNGLLRDFFEGFGQQAFIGYAAPAPKDDFLNLWRPLDEIVPGAGESVVRFAVLMQIVDSTNGRYDDFRWSAYNAEGEGHRLFSVGFDNASAEIFFALDDEGPTLSSGFSFHNDVVYYLEIFMNFSRNDWLATLNGFVVIDSQPITTTGTVLSLADMDAVWALQTPGMAGDNYMLFDEYEITVEPGDTIPPILEPLGMNEDGEFELVLHGELGLTYAIDVTSDFVTWQTLGTYTLEEGLLYFVDTTSVGVTESFYRAREAPPAFP